MGSSHEGAHGPYTEIGVHGKGIGSEGRVDTEERLGVGIVGGPDIFPLGVHDDQQPGTARVSDQPLQGPEPTPPVPFVEGGLGFDQTDRPDCSPESDVGESVQPVGCVPDSPLVKYRPGGVQPPGERSVFGSHRPKPGRERVGHTLILARRDPPMLPRAQRSSSHRNLTRDSKERPMHKRQDGSR